MTQYQAKIYPNTDVNPTITYADTRRKNIAVCFSGGGSRALTCAWGQLIGLNTLKDENGNPLFDEVRYISSVSGGSWAAVLYTFLPETVSYADFLGNSYHPSQLFYHQDTAGGLNVSVMGDKALGKIPQNFANLFELDPLKNIIVDFVTITALKGIPLSTSAKWLWSYIVGRNVLADFDLYKYRFSLFQTRDITPWHYPDASYFSLSKNYADKTIFSQPLAPSEDEFTYARTKADDSSAGPLLIINTNIIDNAKTGALFSNPLEIPTQVTALAGGIYGANPLTEDHIGGGSIESFAFTSNLNKVSDANQVLDDFNRRYELADITACSSAFYAETLADPLEAVISNLLAHTNIQLHTHLLTFLDTVNPFVLNNIRSNLQGLSNEINNLKSVSHANFIKSFVPQYNYWPISQSASGIYANHLTEFTDGGNLDNTGVAGLLAQVRNGINNIIAFVNGSEVLEISNGEIIAATQIAPLFGVAYDGIHNRFQAYAPNGVNPFTGLTDPTGFLQVFDNNHGEFDTLRNDLYNTNNPVDPNNPGQRLTSYEPAFSVQKLTLIDNKLLGIDAGHTVNVLWAQNVRVNHWQNMITNDALQEKIQQGQKEPKGFSEFANFPYYDTFKKIHQNAAETNTLAQLWAWNVGHADSPLSQVIQDFFKSAI